MGRLRNAARHDPNNPPIIVRSLSELQNHLRTILAASTAAFIPNVASAVFLLSGTAPLGIVWAADRPYDAERSNKSHPQTSFSVPKSEEEKAARAARVKAELEDAVDGDTFVRLAGEEDGEIVKGVQRAISREIVAAIESVDNYQYRLRQDYQSSRGREMTLICRELRDTRGRGRKPLIPTHPEHDCEGVIRIAFRDSIKMYEVTYRHAPVHRTIPELIHMGVLSRIGHAKPKKIEEAAAKPDPPSVVVGTEPGGNGTASRPCSYQNSPMANGKHKITMQKDASELPSVVFSSTQSYPVAGDGMRTETAP